MLRICKELFFRTQKLNYLNGNLSPFIHTQIIYNSNGVEIIKAGSVYTIFMTDAKISSIMSALTQYKTTNSNIVVSIMDSTGKYYLGFVNKNDGHYVDSSGTYHDFDDTYYVYGTCTWTN